MTERKEKSTSPAEKPARAKKPSTPKATAPDVPPFMALDGKKLLAVATKVDKTKDPYKLAALLETTAGEDHGAALLWHLARHGLVDPTKNAGLLTRLGDSAGAAPTEALVPVIQRLTNWPKDWNDFPRPVDAILIEALRRAEAELETVRLGLPDRVRVALEMLRGRSGRPVAAEDRARVLAALGHSHGREYGMALGLDYWIVNADGTRTRFMVDRENLQRLVAMFGDDASFRRHLLEGARDRTCRRLENIAPALEIADVDECVAVLASYESSQEGGIVAAIGVLRARDDEPDALLAAASRAEGKPKYLEIVRLAAMARCGARGLDVPAGAEDALTMEHWDRDEPRKADAEALAALYEEAVAALGRERAIARGRKQLEHWARSAVGGILGVYFDAALFAALLDLDANRNMEAWNVAAPGAAAIPEIVRRIEAAATPEERAHYERLLRGPLVIAGRRGETWDAKWDRIVRFADGASNWHERDRAVELAMLRAMPAERRATLLRSALATTSHVERAFRAAAEVADRALRGDAVRALFERRDTIGDRHLARDGLKLLGDEGVAIASPHLALTHGDKKTFDLLLDAFGSGAKDALEAALAGKRETWRDALARLAAGSGPRERIYFLETELAELEPMPGSWSRIGGAGPAIAPPKHAGSPMHHVVTIDLKDVPELAQRYPSARAVALYVPDARSGRYDGSRLVEVPETAGPPTTGAPLVALAVDLPRAVFDTGATSTSPALGELRDIVFNRPGWVLGQPMWIQEPEEEGDFVMQLSENLGLNLGDAGALYVFDGAAVMQSM